VGSATTSWAVPFRATPRLRCPTDCRPEESHTDTWWAAAWRAFRRTPGPSLARHRPYEKSLVAACDVSFPLRVGLDGHPLYAAFRAVVTKDRAGGQVFATGSAFETRVIQDRAPTVCPGTRFVLHQDCEDIAAAGSVNTTRVRCYVTLSGVCVTVFE